MQHRTSNIECGMRSAANSFGVRCSAFDVQCFDTSRLNSVKGRGPHGALRPQPSTAFTPHASRFTFHVSRFTFHASAFTLVELLVVIAILGALAFLVTPAIKQFGKSDATLSASRQLLDDVARARQLAISQRTTVYMVFVPTNFWGTLPADQLALPATTNLCDKQLTGYTFVSLRAVGDQPGQGVPHYLAPWQNLPDGTFIALAKFTNSPPPSPAQTRITDSVSQVVYDIYGFNYTNNIPFPSETNTTAPPSLPYIAFNYLGQLTVDGSSLAPLDEYIPLAKGSISLGRDPVTKALLFDPPDVMEMPPGNSTSSSYNLIHIDRLTGRAVLEFQKLQ